MWMSRACRRAVRTTHSLKRVLQFQALRTKGHPAERTHVLAFRSPGLTILHRGETWHRCNQDPRHPHVLAGGRIPTNSPLYVRGMSTDHHHVFKSSISVWERVNIATENRKHDYWNEVHFGLSNCAHCLLVKQFRGLHYGGEG